MKTILIFFKNLFSSNGEVSSKRVVGFGSFLLICEIVQSALFLNKTISDFIFWGLITLITACFGLNVINNYTKKDNKDG